MRPPRPPYLAIADDIAGQIERGELLPGEQIPSVTVIMDRYRVSRPTARRVLTELNQRGLTDPVPGWGTFVRAGKPGGGAAPRKS